MIRAILFVLLFFSPVSAWAQSGCAAIVYGRVVTVGQWEACFQSKVDATNGVLTNPAITGGFKIPNCAGDGVTDDTVCVQAAFNIGGLIILGPYIYAINSTGITCSKIVKVVGSQGNQIPVYATFSGFRSLATNQTLLNIALGCQGSKFQDFSIDMGHPGTNTSGAAISMVATNNVTFSDIAINAPCIGLDLNGNTIKVDRIQITQVTGSSCGSLRVGHLTTGGATVDPRISNSTLQSTISSPAGYGQRIEDAGGLMEVNNDILFSAVGTQIIPGVNQKVAWGNFGPTVAGDTNSVNALTFDTGDSTAVIEGFEGVGVWASSAGSGAGVTISNTAGGVVSGIHLIGGRFINNQGGNGIAVLASSVTGFTVDSSDFCGNISTGSNISLASGLSGFAIRGNKLGGLCDNQSIQTSIGVRLNGSNANGIITGNDFNGISTAVLGIPTGDSIINNNTILDTEVANAGNGATPSFSQAVSNWVLPDNTTITSIGGGWNNRKVWAYSSHAGGVSITGGAGSTCTNVTLAQYGAMSLTWNVAQGCWLVAQ